MHNKTAKSQFKSNKYTHFIVCMFDKVYYKKFSKLFP